MTDTLSMEKTSGECEINYMFSAQNMPKFVLGALWAPMNTVN